MNVLYKRLRITTFLVDRKLASPNPFYIITAFVKKVELRNSILIEINVIALVVFKL